MGENPRLFVSVRLREISLMLRDQARRPLIQIKSRGAAGALTHINTVTPAPVKVP
jgi:hypothetical protein